MAKSNRFNNQGRLSGAPKRGASGINRTASTLPIPPTGASQLGGSKVSRYSTPRNERPARRSGA